MNKTISTNNPVNITLFVEPDLGVLVNTVNNGFSGDILAASLDTKCIQLYVEDENVIAYFCEKNEEGDWETVDSNSANFLINDSENFYDLVDTVVSWIC